MKIVAADVFVTCPGRNFVTLKITTGEGSVGRSLLQRRLLAPRPGDHVGDFRR